jgi:hypothetical protein
MVYVFERRVCSSGHLGGLGLFLVFAVWLFNPSFLHAGNFYAGITPATVPWTNGIVPYDTNTLTAAQTNTYLAGLREWELAANVKFVPHTNQSRWILFTYNTNYLDNVAVGYNPQVVTVSSLSRATGLPRDGPFVWVHARKYPH